jgi:hypothetical protein
MKKLVALLTAAAIAIPALALADDIQQNAPQQNGAGKVVAQSTVAESAVVKAVDQSKRTITLQLADGSVQTFAVDPSVQRLKEVKPGDLLNVTYTEAVSVKINKNPVQPGVNVETAVTRDEQSVTPAGSAGVQVTTTATIDRIYDDGNKVTLRMPDGSKADVQVRDPDNLAMIQRGEVKKGDQISITYIRAVAVSVEKAPKK